MNITLPLIMKGYLLRNMQKVSNIKNKRRSSIAWNMAWNSTATMYKKLQWCNEVVKGGKRRSWIFSIFPFRNTYFWNDWNWNIFRVYIYLFIRNFNIYLKIATSLQNCTKMVTISIYVDWFFFLKLVDILNCSERGGAVWNNIL